MSRVIQTFKLFFPYCLHRDARWFFFASILVMLIDVFAATMLPFAFSDIIAHLKNDTDFSNKQGILASLCGLFFLYTVLNKTMSFVQDLLFYPVINVAIRELHFKVPLQVHSLPLHTYKTMNVPEILSFTKRIGLSARFFLRTLLVTILPTFIKFIVAFSILYKIGVFRAGLVMGVIVFIVVYIISVRLYLESRRKSWMITDKVTQAIGDSIYNTKIVRFYEAFERKRLRALVNEEARIWFKATMQMDSLQIAIGATIALIIAPMIYLGAIRVETGAMTLATFILLHGQLNAFFVPLKGSVSEIRLIFEAVIDIEKILDLVFGKDPFHTPLPGKMLIPVKGAMAVEMTDVHFSYDAKNVLDHFSLAIEVGSLFQIYGKSGEGKSTLLSLITGLQKPESGSIKLFGHNISELSMSEIASLVHYIPQQIPIFNGTFYQNLTYGLENVVEDDLETAIALTQLDKIIKGLLNGLNTEIGERGAKLSGGEMQRLAFARALLHRPKLLIFDETTNALDFATEKTVFENIRREIETIIFISHRKVGLLENLHTFNLRAAA